MQTKVTIKKLPTGLKLMHLTSAYGTFIRTINGCGEPFNEPLKTK